MIKTELLEMLNGTENDFFTLLLKMRGASPLNEKLVQLLSSLHQGKPFSVNEKKVLHIFFSLSNDGNTRISLDPEKLLKKWATKWEGLVTLSTNGQEDKDTAGDYPKASDFQKIIEDGCKELVGNIEAPLAIEFHNNEPFLYTDKYLVAKKIIEDCFKKGTQKCVFDGNSRVTDEEIGDCTKNIEQKIAATENGQKEFNLRKAQAEAIIKGTQQNLIITGGPGTGKTTVMFFLLWGLLKKNSGMMNWSIYFAAPSGKASDRLRESIGDNIALLTETAKNDPVVEHLKNVDSFYTLHRLLKYDPQNNSFFYNSNNRFQENSIFVIDEASMIDLSLFASFMQALPEDKSRYRLYILGDKDQLPSVEAGAVLGEILDLDSNSVVDLPETNRFDNNSNIGRLSRFIQKKLGEDELQFKLEWKQWESGMSLWNPEHTDEINLLQLNNNGMSLRKAEEEVVLNGLINSWAKRFYRNPENDLLSLAKTIQPELTKSKAGKMGLTQADWERELKNRNALWKIAENARILSAERRGSIGIENLNKLVIESLGHKANAPFDGQLMILTKNQSYFDLYNGDSGIVVNCEVNPTLMLMRKGEFVFYPLSMLPSDALESAFAITIHKSQGSGYPNIMMFLPARKGHPLLNRQILYTGMTRTKKQSLTIVATPETFKAACETVIKRDTGIEL